LVRRQLDQMFSYRHHTTMHDLSLADEYQLSPQRIAISGGSGLVGSNFTALATLLGHSVVPIVRGDGRDENEIAIWADDGKSQAGKFADVDTVIHLAGKPIAEGRWTDAMKESIRDSRTVKTRQLCERLAALPDSQRPKTLICASASGYYGSRGDEQLSEDSPVGEGFLAEVCINWEKACQPAIQAGIRVVHARFGIILSPNSGALQKLLTPTKLGAGGPVGNGQHWWPWIGIDDALGGLYHLIAKPEIHGSVNFAAPESARQKEFAKVLGRVLNRPSFMPAPAFAMRLLLGEMADHLLLTSCRMQPQRLLDTGYQFRFPDLESCLRHLLGRRTLTQASGK
ncbi:MAG: TIGR01777 family oxidoreductase, partial [Planctomycetota bacterium]